MNRCYLSGLLSWRRTIRAARQSDGCVRLAIFGMGALLAACAAIPARYYEDGVFVSRSHPPMRVQISGQFEYLGPEQFMLGTTHRAERHHWVSTENERVKAMIVMQFEEIVDGVEGQYEFNVPPEKYLAGSNYRFSAEPVLLDDQAYVHNTWAFDTRKSAQEQPGRESDRTLKLLAANGYDIDAGLIMARWVRAVGADKRREVILFYMEPLGRHGHTIDEFPDGSPQSDAFDAVSAALVERAREAFRVLPDD